MSSTSACAGCDRSSGPMRRSRRCGMRVTGWLRRNPAEVAGAVLAALSIAAIGSDVEWAEACVIPLVLIIFLGLVWHGRRRQAALAEVQGVAEMRASLLERQERFLH